MTESTVPLTHRFIRIGRRWVRRIVGRLFPDGEAPPYRPRFGVDSLACRLGVDIKACADTNSTQRDREQEIRALSFAGARAARSIFGKRFFVDPQRALAAAQRVDESCPGARAALLEKVDSDCTVGIPLYAGLGPPMSAGFPWERLPLGPGSDSMYLMRPHRFAFAPRHAWASLYEAEAAMPLLGMMESWMNCATRTDSPMYYASNLAVIQRILALSWSWAFLAGRPEEESDTGLGLEWRILQIIEADIHFLEPLLGDSAPNNHLLADWFAGWYLRTVFPELLDNADDNDEERWCRELLAQTYPDGGSFEHSTHYHEFACEMGVAYLLLAKRNGEVPDSQVTERVKALLAYQSVLNGPECQPLPIGNAVEDTLFPLDPGEGWCSGALREYYRALFTPELCPAPARDPTRVRAYWLLGGELAAPLLSISPEIANDSDGKACAARFDQAGVYVMTDHMLDGRLVFRGGPAPETSLTGGHAHSDLLAIYLTLGDQAFLVDAGTYTYRRHSIHWADEPGWRAYFAGPEAHNGFCVPGADPLGPITGDFRRQSIPARVASTAIFGEAVSCVEGSFLGDGPYEGMRRACVQVGGEYWLVLNRPPTVLEGSTSALMGLQLAPQVGVRGSNGRFEIRSSDMAKTLFLKATGIAGEPEILQGSTNPLGGWVSPRYGELQAAPQFRFASVANTPSAFLLTSRRGCANGKIMQLEYRQPGVWFVHIEFERHSHWILVQPSASSGMAGQESSLRFNGRMLLLRTEQGKPVRLDWLDGSSLDWPEFGIRLHRSNDAHCDLSLDNSDTMEEQAGQFAEFEWPANRTSQ